MPAKALRLARAHASPSSTAARQRRLRHIDYDYLGVYCRLLRSRRVLHHLCGAASRSALAVFDLTEIENLTLNHPEAADPDDLHEAPVAVLLAVFEASLEARENGNASCALNEVPY